MGCQFTKVGDSQTPERRTFKFVQVQPDFSLKVEEKEVPKINDDEILVKVEVATINPYDIAYVTGKHPTSPTPPFSAGFEGAGVAVEVGKKHASRIKVGAKVCFLGKGTWAQYATVRGDETYLIHPDNTFEEAASHFINPATLILMLRETQKEGHKAVIHSVGASALGKMLIKLFKENGIKTINLVRRDDVKDELYKLGADYVLNMKDSNFDTELEKIIKKENPTKFYDAICGDFTVKVLKMMPPGSIITVYGFLSKQLTFKLSILDLFAGKTLNCFGLNTHHDQLSSKEKQELSDYIQKRLKTTLKSDVYQTLPLEKITQAVADSEEFASKGKTLLKPWA